MALLPLVLAAAAAGADSDSEGPTCFMVQSNPPLCWHKHLLLDNSSLEAATPALHFVMTAPAQQRRSAFI